MSYMPKTVTVRLDAKAGRALRELMRRNKGTKSSVIKDTLVATAEASAEAHGSTAREVYARLLPNLTPAPPGPKRDRARNASRLLKEILIAKLREGTSF